jgi:hypothetical protein
VNKGRGIVVSKNEGKKDKKIIDLNAWKEMQKYEDEPDTIRIKNLHEILDFIIKIRQILKGEIKLKDHTINIESSACQQLIIQIDDFFNQAIFFDGENLNSLNDIMTNARDIFRRF